MILDVHEALDYDGGLIIAAFASGDQTRFEWGGTLRRLGLPHVLFRDSSSRWYANGINGVGCPPAAVGYLKALRGRYGRLITLGLSSGAHAALRYGHLARADKVIAISPVTCAGPAAIAEFPDWPHRLGHDHAVFEIKDLAEYYLTNDCPKVRAFHSDGPGTELDRDMIARLGVFPCLLSGYSHDRLARGMRDLGMIDKLLSE